MRYHYTIVDAFTPIRFLGNAAGVVRDAEDLPDKTLRAIAAEINLSETAFVLQPTGPDAEIRIRWFTPQVEVKMCGHATLATAHALAEAGEWSARALLRIETLSGVLAVEAERIGEQQVLWLHMPTPKLVRKAIDPTRLAELCGLDFKQIVRALPIVQTQDQDVIVPVQDFQVLQGARPRFGELGEFCRLNGVRGVCLTTREAVSAAVTLQSRFFAPAVGIDEDPATGSVHGPLAAYAVLHNMVTLTDGEALIECLQTPATARVGVVRVRIHQDRNNNLAVKVGGQCVTSMRGELIVD